MYAEQSSTSSGSSPRVRWIDKNRKEVERGALQSDRKLTSLYFLRRGKGSPTTPRREPTDATRCDAMRCACFSSTSDAARRLFLPPCVELPVPVRFYHAPVWQTQPSTYRTADTRHRHRSAYHTVYSSGGTKYHPKRITREVMRGQRTKILAARNRYRKARATSRRTRVFSARER